jgi:hypothetical protein
MRRPQPHTVSTVKLLFYMEKKGNQVHSNTIRRPGVPRIPDTQASLAAGRIRQSVGHKQHVRTSFGGNGDSNEEEQQYQNNEAQRRSARPRKRNVRISGPKWS